MNARAEWIGGALEEAAQSLLTLTGQEWLQARDSALARTNEDFTTLLEQMTRPTATDEEKCVAVVLRSRREHPGVAAAFDQAVIETLASPGLGRHMRPIYSLGRLTGERWILGFEILWKRNDLPGELHVAVFETMPRDTMPVELLLVMLAERPLRGDWIACRLSGAQGAPWDPRVYTAMVDIYTFGREQLMDSSSSMHQAEQAVIWTAHLGTPQALDALHGMERFERALMQQRGLAPWDDNGEAEVARREAGQRYSLALNVNNLPPALAQHQAPVPEGERQALIAAAKEERDRADSVYYSVLLWQQFDTAYQILRDKGIPADRAPAGP